MSLFGSSPPREESQSGTRSLFDDDGDVKHNKPLSLTNPKITSSSNSLFDAGADDKDDVKHSDDESGGPSWGLPTRRKKESRAEMVRNLLPSQDVPESYIDAFDAVVQDNGNEGKVNASGIDQIFAAAGLEANERARVLTIIAPEGATALDRGEFNVLLALIALAQAEGVEHLSLDAVDERRRQLPEPQLKSLVTGSSYAEHDRNDDMKRLGDGNGPGSNHNRHVGVSNPLTTSYAIPSAADELSAKPPQVPIESDPWNTPDVHRDHNHPPQPDTVDAPGSRPLYFNKAAVAQEFPSRTTSAITAAPQNNPGQSFGNTLPGAAQNSTGAWGGLYDEGGFADAPLVQGAGFGAPPVSVFSGPPSRSAFGAPPVSAGFGGTHASSDTTKRRPAPTNSTTASATVASSANNEKVDVTLMSQKDGMFLFQHHNYEVTCARRNTKVVRRYSDFVWLLDCLHKRYPCRALPLLPPKRVAVNGNHFSNDNAFMEKRRRGLYRFLNALVRHPVLGQEYLVVMFLSVPTELSVWRKQQSKINLDDEFADVDLRVAEDEPEAAGQLDALISRSRRGIRRYADLYIALCNNMDRLCKRSEGMAADHARMALSLMGLMEASEDTYAVDTSDVPALNAGLSSMAKHLRTAQHLMEDEARAWDSGVLEDLKRQRDALVSVRDMFDRRDRYDRDNIPQLEKRIERNQAKLVELRSRTEGTVRPGEVEKLDQAIASDKDSIVKQRNRSVLVRECMRDELIHFQNTQWDTSRWNQDWAQERVKYTELLAENWRTLLDEVDGMPLGR